MGCVLVACEEIVGVIGAARAARARQRKQATTTDSTSPADAPPCCGTESGATTAYQKRDTGGACAKFCDGSIGGAADTVGADDLLPALIYVVIHAAPRQLHSNIAFILQVCAGTKSSQVFFFSARLITLCTPFFVITSFTNSMRDRRICGRRVGIM